MLVATPGQTASYSTLHNNSSNGGGSNNTAGATSTTKKSSNLNSTNANTSGTAKSLNNNNNHTTSNVTTKNSLNTHSTTFNYHADPKNDSIVSNKICNQNKAVAPSREIISSTKPAAANHSLRSENSTTTTTSTTTLKQQSLIQTLKDSVQKALISTTGNSSNKNAIVNKLSADNKLKNSCNNSTTSINNVTSSSSSTSYNANKVSTTTSSNTSSNSTSVTQSSSSTSGVRSKHYSCSLSKLHTVAPTVIHRYPEERQHASSTDSLQKEMCHFKPIRIVPKTPWKSGSKSRGNCLRFPKANLATKKTDFVLKPNCDVINRKKKQQQNRTQNDKINVDEVEDDDNEQENKEIQGIYKPKPSLTCLSTSITTPNHQSAFVCLVAQMKNLVNLQSKRQHILTKSVGSYVDESSDESLKELYVSKRQNSDKIQHMEEETSQVLPKIRSTRLSLNKLVSTTTTNPVDTKEIVKRINDKTDMSKVSTPSVRKSKSRRKLGRAKSKTINMVALSATKAKEKLQNSVSMPAIAINKKQSVTTASKNTRKRKMAEDMNELLTTSSSSASTSVKSLSLRARKSARLSTSKQDDATNILFKYPTNQNTIKPSRKSHKNSKSVLCFSPPLTRSRLKRLVEEGKIVTTSTADIRKI